MSSSPVIQLQKYGSVSLALALAVTIGFLDCTTSYDVNVTPFYLIPICWVGWVAGRRGGMFLAMMCTGFWLLADLTAGHLYQHPVLRYWNALMLLAFFTAVVYLLSKLQRRTTALEAEIVERKRLEEAKLHAERLATVGAMAAQVAHEVRNPLGSITLNLDLIAKEVETLSQAARHPAEEGHALVKEMRAEVHRMQSVIEDYLRFARLRKPQRRSLQLNEFLEQKLAFMGTVFDGADVCLRTEFDDTLRPINADPEQLWQALLNLVRNSLEAMPGGGTLTVSTQGLNNQALLKFTDTGRGMTEDQVKQMFHPFFTTKTQGTGLGLPLTEQILNEHGAQVECISAVGKGTTFTIRFALNEKT